MTAAGTDGSNVSIFMALGAASSIWVQEGPRLLIDSGSTEVTIELLPDEAGMLALLDQFDAAIIAMRRAIAAGRTTWV